MGMNRLCLATGNEWNRMSTRIIKVDTDHPLVTNLAPAIDALRDGGLVAFPTETVYGVACRADLDQSMQRLRAVKQRPANQASTLHVGTPEQVTRYVPHMSTTGTRLMRKSWPGPLTIITQVSDEAIQAVSDQFGQLAADNLYLDGTIGLRCPDDQVAGTILRQMEYPVVMPSANRAGNPPPRDAQDVLKDLNGQIDVLVDAGATRYGKASTIVRLVDNTFEVVREGVLDSRTVTRLATCTILFVCTGNTCRSPMAEGLCRHLLAERLGVDESHLLTSGYRVASAGTFGANGMPATSEAIEAVRQYGVDISTHRSTTLTPNSVNQADIIFALTADHLEHVRLIAPHAADRTTLLDPDGDIPDPIGEAVQKYHQLARHMKDLIDIRVQEILP